MPSPSPTPEPGDTEKLLRERTRYLEDEIDRHTRCMVERNVAEAERDRLASELAHLADQAEFAVGFLTSAAQDGSTSLEARLWVATVERRDALADAAERARTALGRTDGD